jgi:hypothetical protein
MAKLYGDAFDAGIRIVKRGRGFIEQIKDRSEIELIEFTRNNRDELQEELPGKSKQSWKVVSSLERR